MVLTTMQPGLIKSIWPNPPPSVLDEGIDIVIIPGVWTPYTAEQRKRCSWLKPLAASSTNDTRVFFYAYELVLGRSSSLWNQLASQGYCLIQAIQEYRMKSDTNHRPLLFIAHSLGGVLLKRALHIAHEARENGSGQLEDVVCGIIFLGTPHLTSTDDPRWERWRLIMKANRKEISRASLSTQDIAKMADICQNFESLDLQVPILSCFEKRETKIRDSIISIHVRGSNIKLVLVDEVLARTGAKHEEMLEVDTDHNNLSVVPVPGPFFDRLVLFLKGITEKAPADVANLLRQLSQLNSNDSFSANPDMYDWQGEERSNLDRLHPKRDFSVSFKPLSLPVHMMSHIQRNGNFMGRQDILERIDERFGSGSSNETPVAAVDRLETFVLCGLGGIGKTEIAAEFALSRKDKFDVVFWIAADTTAKLSAGYARISRLLDFRDESGHLDEVASRNAVKDWLSQPKKPVTRGLGPPTEERISWLIVFDNIDDPEILHDYWPQDDSSGCIIITSRNPLAKDKVLIPSATIDVPSFKVEEAGKALQALSRRENEDQSFETCCEIATILGGHPLGVTQMAGIIRNRHLSLRDFLEYYEEDAQKLQKMQPPGQHNYSETLSSVWAVEALSVEAVALLRVISLLDPDQIPESILTEGAKHVHIMNYPKKKSAYFDARLELLRSSIIVRDIDNDVIRVHRLVQDVVRQKMTDEELISVFEGTIVLISAIWPFISYSKRNTTDRWHQCELLYPHIAKLRSLFETRIREDQFPATHRAGSLMNEVSWYLVERAKGDEIIEYAALAETILYHLPEDDDAPATEIKRLLSDSYQYQALGEIDIGAPLALKHCKMWVQSVLERIIESNHRDDAVMLGTAYGDTGMAYMRESNDKEAIESFQLSMETLRNVENPSRIDETWPAVHLGCVYAIHNRGNEIDEELTTVLKIREETFGKDDMISFETGKVLQTLGSVRLSQHRLDEALDFFQRALTIYRATIGDNHYVTADCCYLVAKQFVQLKRYDEARTLFSQCLKVYGDIPWYKPQAARAAFKHGRLLRFLGNVVEGNLFLERAMKLRKELVPKDDRSEEQLLDRDFDVLVYYFSR